MKKLYFLFLIFLAGCGSTKYYVQGSKVAALVPPTETISIVENTRTRSGFLTAITNWLDEHNYAYTIVSKKPNNAPYLRYEGKWSWDLTIYLREGFISFYSNNRMASRCKIHVPNNLNLSKFKNGEDKIYNMMDLLFYRHTDKNIQVIKEDED